MFTGVSGAFALLSSGLTVDTNCLVDGRLGDRGQFTVTAAGLDASSDGKIAISVNNISLRITEKTVKIAADGSAEAMFYAGTSLYPDTPGQYGLQIYATVSGTQFPAYKAELTYAKFGVTATKTSGRAAAKTNVSLYGFDQDKTIYAHYLNGSASSSVKDLKVAQAAGACGVTAAKKITLAASKKTKAGKYLIRFDQNKKYQGRSDSSDSNPQAELKVSIKK